MSIENPPPKRVAVVLEVSKKGWGFGSFRIVQTPKGVFIDTECSAVSNVKDAFAALIDGAITDHEEDPARHKLYNEEMRSHCGPGCDICYPRSSAKKRRK